jgi:2,4-dienoyl-CoA reductase-like NADH-dependent reductase (Old Yellow Enzyme family)
LAKIGFIALAAQWFWDTKMSDVHVAEETESRIEEIEAVVKGFGDVAEILVRVGVDGVEIHGHEGYLLDQFATALWNRRSDKYGGSLRDRLRFAFEIVQEIKKRGLELNEKNERFVRESLREEHGMAAYARLSVPRIDNTLKSSNVVVDGLYSWEEYIYLKDYYRDNFLVVAVWSARGPVQAPGQS